MSLFSPGLWRSGTSWTAPSGTSGRVSTISSGQMFWLPCPVKNLPTIFESKVVVEEPNQKVGGNAAHNQKLKTSAFSLTGEVARTKTVSGDAVYDDLEMFDLFWDFSDFCSQNGYMELFFFYDLATTEYRKFKKVVFSSISADIGDMNFNLYKYTLQLHRLDPVVYTTAPGA
ncbi:hypothetical protein UFOVP785_38 [uncultured Caudovirales phage]|uniref:Uncharacterized protein n=1 Tax=uncultured Caudovirales phage TaxID=2100421 RepID=A0A6J5NRM1_9CAUD|nr:hypothetical protein UFOVP785_38 [uncultured Caudovirales phage]